jgi:lipoate-protein ligase A
LIDKIKYIITTETNPYKNLALEEYLLKQVGEQECILYLWQNEKTVVIGKNQNPWKECRITELEADGGKLVRRLSGGGAVFHDLGNLNFTFLVAKDNYNVEKQLEVIIKAVNQLGIPAEKSGRNDITVEGKKFSGNAFYSDGFHSYHHGTILVNVDMSKLSLYLNVSKDKLVSKGVESVRSRVTNLTSYKVDLDISRMQKELILAFGEVYGLQPTRLEVSEINLDELVKLEEKFSSWDWIYGKKMEFNYSLDRRFAWGDIDLRFVVDSGKIKQCAVYSDALETDLFEQLAQGLTGCVFSPEAMIKVIESMRMTPGIGSMQKNTGTQEKDFNTDIQNNILNDILADIMTLIND